MSDDQLNWEDSPETLVQEFPVLGIPVRFETNDAHVHATVERAYRGWDAIRDRTELLSSQKVRFRIMVDADEDLRDESACRYYMPDFDRVVVTTERSVGIADALRRDVFAGVTKSLVADEERFRYAFVEALTFALLTRLDRQPFHAAGVVREGVALLLAGPTGIGKSTIAYSAVRSGLQVLAEDAVYIQLKPRLRIWGMPQHLRLRSDAKAHFPELADQRVRQLPNGKRKLTIDLRGAERVLVVEQAGLCLLTRHSGPAVVERLDPKEALAELSAHHEPGFDVFTSTIGERLLRVASRGCWRLNLSDDPQEAMPCVHQMFAELGQRARTPNLPTHDGS